MSEFYVRWYDDYDCLHVSKVYFIDSTRDRFLVVKESGILLLGQNRRLRIRR